MQEPWMLEYILKGMNLNRHVSLPQANNPSKLWGFVLDVGGFDHGGMGVDSRGLYTSIDVYADFGESIKEV